MGPPPQIRTRLPQEVRGQLVCREDGAMEHFIESPPSSGTSVRLCKIVGVGVLGVGVGVLLFSYGAFYSITTLWSYGAFYSITTFYGSWSWLDLLELELESF